MQTPLYVLRDTSCQWMSSTDAVTFFQRDPSIIWDWCNDGTCIEAGFRLYRDLTGHWWIGIPHEQLRRCGT